MSAVRTLMDHGFGPARRPWRAVHLAGQSFIYTPTGDFLCVVTNPSMQQSAQVNADFIIRACHHHDALVRLVKTAVGILSDGAEENIPLGLGISPVLVREFFHQALEILHQSHKSDDW